MRAAIALLVLAAGCSYTPRTLCPDGECLVRPTDGNGGAGGDGSGADTATGDLAGADSSAGDRTGADAAPSDTGPGDVVLPPGDTTVVPIDLFGDFVDIVAGVSEGVFAVSTADFNLDAFADYAYITTTGRIVLRQATSSAGVWTDFTTVQNTAGPGGASPVDIAAVDYDVDGDADVLIIYDTALVRLINQRPGYIMNPITQSTNDNVAAVIADHDCDGYPDVTIADRALPGIRRYTNNRGGGFVEQTGTLPMSSSTRWLATADVDRDGREDLLARHDGGIQIYPGDCFSYASGGSLVPAPKNDHFTVADFNRDAYPDASVLDDDSLRLLRGSNTMGPRLTETTTSGDKTSYTSQTLANRVVTADFTGNGRADLAIAHSGAPGLDPAEGVVIRLGDGQNPMFGFPGSSYGVETSLSLIDVGPMTIADFNRDGDPDIAVGALGAAGQTVILVGDGITGGGLIDGAGVGVGFTGVEPVAPTASIVAVGDFDLDGHPDFMGADTSNAYLFVNDGNGASFTGGPPTALGPSVITDAEVADIDFDGVPEVVLVSSAAGSDRIHVLNPAGSTFSSTTDATLSSAAVHGLALGDVDRDGDLDAVTAENSGGSLFTWINTRAGFAPHNIADRVTGLVDPYDVQLGDVNQDGLLDAIVLRNPTQTLETYIGIGTAPWFGPVGGATISSLIGTPRALALGDIDRDGHLDAVAVGDGTSIVVIRGSPMSPYFGASVLVSTVGEHTAVELADMDRDGDLDIVTVSTSAAGPGLHVYPLTDPVTPTFGPAEVQGGGLLLDVALGDVNRDGDLDALAASQGPMGSGGIWVMPGL